MKKSTMLRSLLMSGLSVLLCVSMLMGSTFAWFTDTVESGINTIVAGNLDIELWNGDKQIKGEDSDPEFFDDVTLWEPGAMAVETFTVKNAGNLALKYSLEFNVTDPAEGVSLAEVLQIAVVEGVLEGTDRIDPAEYEWQSFESFVLKGALDLSDDENKEDVYTFIVWWQPSDNDNNFNMNNENQGKTASIEFSLVLFATQMAYEEDSFGSDYDAGAPWTGEINIDWYEPDATEYVLNSADELAGLAAIINGTAVAPVTTYAAGEAETFQDFFEGKTIKLSGNVDLGGLAWTPIGSATADHGFMGNFDGNGYTIYNLCIKDIELDEDGYAYAGFFGVTEGTADAENYIKNLKIENVTIETTGHIVAAAIAYPYYTTVENVTVCGDIVIKGGNYTAGALAYTRYCVNASNVTVSGNAGSYITGAQVVGGVIPDIQMNGGLVANYSNFSASNVTITGDKMVGGISGIISKQTLNGATVKNVTLVCSDARVGIVAGSYDSKPVINDAVYSNVTGATAVAGAPWGSKSNGIVVIDGVEYAGNEAAFKAQLANGTVNLACDIVLDEAITIDGTVILNLNGNTITYNSTTQGEAMITNKGNLTINDSVGTGVINYNYTGAADPSYGKGNYTISNCGTLTVNGGKITIANLSGHAKYPIDNNSTTSDAVLVINGGHLYNYNTSAIRQFCNSTTYKNDVTINGGLIEGYCAIWMQNPGNKTVNGTLTITGGEIRTTAKAYVNGTAALTEVSSSLYCTTAGGAWSADSFVSITGGIFNENVNLAASAPTVTVGSGATFNGNLSK